jgi:hypothetical protein
VQSLRAEKNFRKVLSEFEECKKRKDVKDCGACGDVEGCGIVKSLLEFMVSRQPRKRRSVRLF